MSTSNQQEHDTPSEKDNWFIKFISSPVGIILLFVSIICICWVFPWWLPTICTSPPDEQATFGTYGDQYGALNTLFSGLAFAGLLIAILLQRKDLKIQMKAIQDANKASKEQTALMQQQIETTCRQFEDQTSLMAEQSLSACMFSHLEAMQKHKENIYIPYRCNRAIKRDDTPEAKGEQAIAFVSGRICSLINDTIILYINLQKYRDSGEPVSNFTQWIPTFSKIQSYLYHLQTTMGYFRNWVIPFILWNKRVYHSEMTDIKKRDYTELLFNSLTREECYTLLAYSIFTKSSLYCDGSNTPPDPSVLGDFWFSINPPRRAPYEEVFSLLYCLLNPIPYGNNELIHRITEFYETQITASPSPPPAAAEDTPS